jgi:anti-sigma regulatory factor (Ser/Thr protein kinase)
MFEACADLACELTAVAHARRFVAQTVRSWEVTPAHLDDAVLLASELVANAVLHARTETRLTVFARSSGALRVEVYDDNSRVPAAAAPPDDATSGRGLQVIEQVASNWGVERYAGGKKVWFEVGDFRIGGGEHVDTREVRSVDERLDEIEGLVSEDC